MKIKIRKSYETNSSSSHSLTIGENKTKEDLTSYKNTDIFATGGGYGWGPDVLDTFMDKLNYICQASVFNPCLFKIAYDLIKTRLNSTLYFTDDEENNYIDHDSLNILNCNEDELEKLLFMDDSYIYILNDNTQYFIKDGKNGEVFYLEDNDSYKYRKPNSDEPAYGELQLVSIKNGVIFEMKFETKNDIKKFIAHFEGTDFYEFVNSNLSYYT